jgi:hypothetical protein
LAIDDLDFMAIFGKKIGGGGSNHACSEHESLHGASLAFTGR